MTRFATAAAVFGVTAAGAAAGVFPPLPRIPAAALKPAPKPDQSVPAAEGDDPAKVADRILENSKAAADRLKDEDAGEDTRRKQEQTLKDIDALLKQASNSPPMGGGGGSGDMNPDMNPQGSGGGGGKSSSGGQGQGGGSGQKGGKGRAANKGGGSDGGQAGQKSGDAGGSPKPDWRERRQQERGASGQKPDGGDQTAGGKDQKPAPDPAGKDPGQPASGAGGNDVGRVGKSPPALPLDDAVTKQVWGHLPERLRQQMSQYYKEQYMPKYNDLLRQYYASLAEREKAARKP